MDDLDRMKCLIISFPTTSVLSRLPFVLPLGAMTILGFMRRIPSFLRIHLIYVYE